MDRDDMSKAEALISTEQLAAIPRSNLRVFDCTTHLDPAPSGSDDPYVVVSGRQGFEEEHVPGADFLDLQGEFSDPDTPLRFMMPAVSQLEAAFGRHGFDAGAR